MEDCRRELQLVYKDGRKKILFFNEFSDLRGRNDLDLTGVSSARIRAKWPRDSAIGHGSDFYVELEDAKKYMKKLGFEFKPLRKSPFLREEKPAAREETRPQEQKPAAEQPYIPKSDGIYIIKYHESKTEEVLVSYNGVEFTMPLLRKGASRATTKASDCTLGSDIECVSKTSSHRIGERGSLTMVGLAALLEKAERAKADIITFSLTGRDRLSGDKIGAYNFFRYTGEPDSKPFKGYDVESLREKLEKAKLKTTAPISQ